jgi:RNA polymerase sigma factor (sigma-70 family)
MAQPRAARTADGDTPMAVTASGTTREPGGIRSKTTGVLMGQDADGAVTALYHMHYRPLVRLAALLVHDIDVAEELVQDSFVAMHSAWRMLADSDRALSYLYRAVVTRSRSGRHHTVASKILPELAPGIPAIDLVTITEFGHSAVVSALRTLAPRQREVLVLLYYAGLPEDQTASAMRTSKRAVKSYAARAMASLRAELHGIDR